MLQARNLEWDMVGHDDRKNIYKVWERPYRHYWENKKSKDHTDMGKESAQMQRSTTKFRRVTEQGCAKHDKT